MSRPPRSSAIPTNEVASQAATVADHGTKPTTPERMALRLEEMALALGVSRRTLERERSAGRFPRPDLLIGKMPLWRPETIRKWIEAGGA